jgi:hypothetical protein
MALYFLLIILYNITMNTTDEIIKQARARFDHASAKLILREKYEARMIFAHRGGMWRAGPELLAVLQSIPVDDEVVILDLYENPVKIDPRELQYIVLERWQEQMNAWYVEFEENNKQR